jgi:DNA-binding transcriptional regulator PaaX
MPKKQDFSKKILKILSEKPAISMPELKEKMPQSKQEAYAVTRSLKGLKEGGLIESHSSGQNDYARLTKEGKKKAYSIKLDNTTSLVDTTWDGYWRIVMLDLPEDRKAEREALRYLLKKAGFVLLKNSIWISMYPFEHLFKNIKKDLGLTTEFIIFVTNTLDEETKIEFLKIFKN